MPVAPFTGLRRLLLLHGLVTLAAALVLIVRPALIPGIAGVALTGPGATFLACLLAAAELGVAVLSLGAARLVDPRALRLVALSLAVFHASSAVLELYAGRLVGLSGVIVANVTVRALIVALLMWLAPRTREW
jgi:acyl dehydratase